MLSNFDVIEEMKKNYIKPAVSFEDIMSDSDILAGSGSKLGNAQQQINTEEGGFPIDKGIETEENGESGAKGSFAFNDSWEEEMW